MKTILIMVLIVVCGATSCSIYRHGCAKIGMTEDEVIACGGRSSLTVQRHKRYAVISYWNGPAGFYDLKACLVDGKVVAVQEDTLRDCDDVFRQAEGVPPKTCEDYKYASKWTKPFDCWNYPLEGK